MFCDSLNSPAAPQSLAGTAGVAALTASSLPETVCARLDPGDLIMFFHSIVSHIPMIQRCKGQL